MNEYKKRIRRENKKIYRENKSEKEREQRIFSKKTFQRKRKKKKQKKSVDPKFDYAFNIKL